jgi:hypothetical protein
VTLKLKPRSLALVLALAGTGALAAATLLLQGAASASAPAPFAPPPPEPPAIPAPPKPAQVKPAAPPAAPATPARFGETPDLTQTDPELELPGNGESHCAPVAASNALVWLANQGHEPLLPVGGTEKERQKRLVKRLSSARFMSTNELNGTSSRAVLAGLHRYLESVGVPYKRLAYQGWRAHQARFATGVAIPELGFIRGGLGEHSMVLINAGWYRPLKDGRLFMRRGGHWLAVVGAGVDEHGAPDPNVLVLRDSAPYAGDEPALEYARLEPIERGYLNELKTVLPARGYQRLTGGMHVKRPGEVAILDGVVVLEL